jgi:Uma2 family endonuclease
MSAATVPAPTKLITAEEYLHLAPDDRPSELVRGRIVVMNPPFSNHGYWCGQMYHLIREFVDAHNLGRVLCNDAGVVTEREPDSVRGADVAYYSYERVPRGEWPERYWGTPDLICEVRSSDDRWKKIVKKVGEYLEVGVPVVWVVDPEDRCVQVFSAEQPVKVLHVGETLTCPDVLPGFALPLARIFE